DRALVYIERLGEGFLAGIEIAKQEIGAGAARLKGDQRPQLPFGRLGVTRLHLQLREGDARLGETWGELQSLRELFFGGGDVRPDQVGAGEEIARRRIAGPPPGNGLELLDGDLGVTFGEVHFASDEV